MRFFCFLWIVIAFEAPAQSPSDGLRPLQNEIGGLKDEDQRYFKNEAFEGRNKLERIDLNVKEINKLHAELAALKSEVFQLKKALEELKKSK